MNEVTGHRREDESAPSTYQPGDFGRWRTRWYAMTPSGMVAGLSDHTVTEHEDGTISVTPSILVNDGQKDWHGFLKHGVWRY